MAVTVHVKYAELVHNTMRMRILSRKTALSNFSVDLQTSKGEFAEELQKTAGLLQKTGMLFMDLSERTADLLDEARIRFREADASAADQFKNG